MTPDKPQAGAEVDARVAVAFFGWQWFRVEQHHEPPRGRVPYRALRSNPVGHYGGFPLADGTEPVWEDYGEHPPRYSTDPAAAYEMESEIERRGLRCEYGERLAEIVGAYIYRRRGVNEWLLAHATPLQRCLAALAAVGK